MCRRILGQALVVVLLFGGGPSLVGCGLKGDLYLPDESQEFQR